MSLQMKFAAVLATSTSVLALMSGCGPSPCPDKFSNLKPGTEACACNESNLKGSVFGTGTYAFDSSICAAAVHSGAVTPAGGAVKPLPADGCPVYLGSAANGVKSTFSGESTVSFYFADKGDGKCAKVGNGGVCPGRFADVPNEKELTCSCAPKASGLVFGTGVYAIDSDICASAIHAGALTAEGGSVRVKKSEGCPIYLGSAANGQTSEQAGTGDESFFFPDKGDGKCPPPPVPNCPEKFNMAETEVTCLCPANPTGAVWGTSIFTGDSSLCAAALHAGAISAEGGKVVARKAAGCPAYKGSAANTVTSNDWGAFENSFYFAEKGDGTCPAAPTTPCPVSFQAIPDWNNVTSYSCDCPADSVGAVFGSKIYTTDSVLCAAAVHSGVITKTGGKVTVLKTAGCEKYEGIESNGIASGIWGKFDSSFYFEGNHDGSCAK